MRLIRAAGVAAMVLVLAATGCGSGGGKSKAAAVDKLNYLTSFGTFGREAYVWVGVEKGYFKDAGIELAIKPGTGTGDNLKLIASGQADFSPCDFTGTLIQIGKDKLPVTAIAAIHQRSLAGIMTLESTGIATPKDLEGKSIGDPAGSTNGLMFPAYAKLAGIDAGKVKWVNIPPPQLPTVLAAGSVDAIGQFVVGRPTIEKAANGRKAVVLPYSDYLTDLYGNAVVTSTKIAKDKPDLVKRFRDALLKALEYSVDHPDEAAAILVKNQPTQDAKVASAELQLMAAFVRSAGSGAAVGALDSQRVARSIAILQGANAIPPGMTPEQVVSFDLTPKG